MGVAVRLADEGPSAAAEIDLPPLRIVPGLVPQLGPELGLGAPAYLVRAVLSLGPGPVTQ